MSSHSMFACDAHAVKAVAGDVAADLAIDFGIDFGIDFAADLAADVLVKGRAAPEPPSMLSMFAKCFRRGTGEERPARGEAVGCSGGVMPEGGGGGASMLSMFAKRCRRGTGEERPAREEDAIGCWCCC